MSDDVTPALLSTGTYTPAERLSRIRIYVAQAALVSLVGGVVHLSAMTDEQLAHTSVLRWILLLLVLVLSPVLEGLNALRAAIDRSTAAPAAPAAPDATSASNATSAPGAPTHEPIA